MNNEIAAVSLPLPGPLLDQMKDTPQNPAYHAEGSVYNHTCLVLSQFEQHNGRFDLSDRRREVLRWACIVHDLGKPVVTRWIGRWSARGHEAAGVPVARSILQQSQLTPNQKQEVLALVRYHSAPLQMGLRGAPIDDYKLLATRIDLRLLGQFAWFDLHGRVCVNQQAVYDIIDHFLEVIVPRVEYEFGAYDHIQNRFVQAGFQKKNALWHACHQRNHPLLATLLSQESDPGEKQPGFQVVLPMVYGNRPLGDFLREQWPAHRYFACELPASDEDSQHIRSNHLRSARHFVSVFGKAGKALLIEGPWHEHTYRDELVAFIRQQGGAIRLLEVEALEGSEWRELSKPESYPATWIDHQPHLIHPWQFHGRAFMSLP